MDIHLRADIDTPPPPAGADHLAAAVARARQAMTARAADVGLDLFVADDWGGLDALNARNRNSWFPLLPRPAAAPAFWVGARDAAGDVVATHGVVLVDCAGVSFGDRLADLSLFHDHGRAPSEEWCFCASEAAYDTHGRVGWIVAGWTRPDWRGKGVFHLVGRFARAVSWTRWRPLWWVGLVDPETVPVWSGRAAGRRRIEARPGVLYHQAGVGRLPLHVMRLSRAGFALDMQAVAAPAPQCRVIADRMARSPEGSAQPISA
ncbi:hypothetical protein [Azospirillum sp. ST 5-10]|uniref:hypothetical protein n=1 Tax=unclassified Azospirillum TaxID=2630922 RepID=UPI003F4A0508